MSYNRDKNCDLYSEGLSLFALGDLPEVEQSGIRNHLAICEDCRRRLEELQKITLSLTDNSLPGETPAWLEAAAAAVLQRVVVELNAEETRLSHNQTLEAGALPRVADRARKSGPRHLRGWAWLAMGAVAAAIVWILVSNWWASVRNVLPEQTLDPKSIVEVRPAEEPSRTGVEEEIKSEFPTWWELRRSWAESEEAFERALARGHSQALSQPIEMNRLLQELSQ